VTFRVVFAALGAAACFAGLDELNVDDPALQYTTRATHDPIAELSRNVKTGKVTLRFDDQRGYLPAILEALDIPVESQMAVFSKTSVQSMRIGPGRPRALYFNDSVAIGWVPRGTIELAALDPEQGIVFYSVDQRRWTTESGRSDIFQRRTDCLHCHIRGFTGGVPGMLIRSVSTTLDGTPRRVPPGIDTDYRTPFEKLWGGWYVTGESGTGRHLGATATFDAAPYLSAKSDIVALLVFEHQTRVMNLLVEAGWRERVHSGRAEQAARDLADALMFEGEAQLPDKVHGTSGFAEKFAARGPLREFDLQHRLMRNRCSWMVYSPAFDTLPASARSTVYRRMWDVLQTRPEDERSNIVRVLRSTKPDLPEYFRANVRK